jgi:hypothetical protein
VNIVPKSWSKTVLIAEIHKEAYLKEVCSHKYHRSIMTIEEFIAEMQKRPLPSSRLGRVQTLAKELTEGSIEGVWDNYFLIEIYVGGTSFYDDTLTKYLEERWNNNYPPLRSLVALGYMTVENNERFYLTPLTHSLLHDAVSATIFISYKRSESSAFALLIRDRLEMAGLSPFVDMQLEPGQLWNAELEKNIKNSDYFIILLGNKTLESTITIQEIQWALDAKIAIIPIWHNGFAYKSGDWSKIPLEVDNALRNTHTIRVIEENPLTYDTALRELLNRFGISS